MAPPNKQSSGRESGDTGIWDSNAVNGTGSYSYQWYIKNNASDTWHTAGTTSDLTHTFINNTSSVQMAKVRVDVTSGSESISTNMTVSVVPAGCGPQIICK